jgi:thiamine biosynthesis lipoprotein
VEAAVGAAGSTGGLVDPTRGARHAALGYDRDFDELTPVPEAPENSPVSPTALPATVVPQAWREIELEPAGAIRVPAGVALDLGATGKAFAADLIARTVPARAGTDLIISLGGDVAVGYRPFGGPPFAGPDRGRLRDWPVSVAERLEGAELPEAEVVFLRAGGIATSSVTKRRWLHDGRAVHHLLDPRTHRPVEQVWRTATVAATSCVEANTASTASIILGARAPSWLTERNLAARLVDGGGGVLRVCGWPGGDEC